MTLYSKKVIEHFRRPHNVGEIKDADGVGQAGNIVCGDVMYLYIKVGCNKKGEEIIKDIKFKTYGCLAAIASSSMLCDLVKGKTLKEAIAFQKEEIIKSLGGLPPIKTHCSVLAREALLEAIYNYFKKNKRPIPDILKKHHQKTIKEMRSLEKRYKNWLKIEKEI